MKGEKITNEEANEFRELWKLVVLGWRIGCNEYGWTVDQLVLV